MLIGILSAAEVSSRMSSWFGKIEFIESAVDTASASAVVGNLASIIKDAVAELNLYKVRLAPAVRSIAAISDADVRNWDSAGAPEGTPDHTWLTASLLRSVVESLSAHHTSCNNKYVSWVSSVWSALEKEVSSSSNDILTCFKGDDGKWLDVLAPDPELSEVMKNPKNLRLCQANRLLTAFSSNPSVRAIVDPNAMQLVNNMLTPQVKQCIAIQTAFVGVMKEGVQGEDAPAYCSKAQKTIQSLKVEMHPLLAERLNRLASIIDLAA
jgi:hypothetical protein